MYNCLQYIFTYFEHLLVEQRHHRDYQMLRKRNAKHSRECLCTNLCIYTMLTACCCGEGTADVWPFGATAWICGHD